MVTTLRSPKNTGRTPEGRESWEGAKNQARGNIGWMLDNFNPEEIAEMMAEEAYKEEKNVYPPKKRFRRIKILINYFSEMEKQCRGELNRIEKVCDFDDLDLKQENTSLEKPEVGL